MKEKKNGLETAANWVVRVTGCVIFVFLVWYASRFTQYMRPEWQEIPANKNDSMLINAAFAGLAMILAVLFVVLERHINDRKMRIILWMVLGAVMVWMEAAGLWWINSADRIPEGDQAFVYSAASYFQEGNFVFFQPGGYCEMFPYQLGLIALLELLFLVVGAWNYYAFQIICIQLIVGIVWLGYGIVRNMTERMSIALLYCILIACCLPLIFYSGWVYGDIPSIFFILLMFYMLLRYLKLRKKSYLAGIVFAVTMAMLTRTNSLIVLIALCLAALVYVIQYRDKRLLAAVLCAVLCPVLIQSAIYKMYEVRSGYEHSKGIPFTATIVMGLQERNGAYGWYNNYQKTVYFAEERDRDAANEVYLADLKERLTYMKENPSYAVKFVKEKVLSQWNQPLFQSAYFGTKVPGGYEPDWNVLADRISFLYYDTLLAFNDRLQFVIFVGMGSYFLFAVRRNSNILRHTLAISIIGGFIFSIIWEAKSRYIFPYYIMMFPMAAVGYEQMLLTLRGLFLHFLKDRNIIGTVSKTDGRGCGSP